MDIAALGGDRTQASQRAKILPNAVYVCDTITVERDILSELMLSEEDPLEERRDQRLDLAFLFACPLVTVYQNQDALKLKPMASPDYAKEFSLMMKNIGDTKKSIKYTKSVATVTTFQRCLNEMPVALHFSGHGITNRAFSNDRAQEGDFLVFEDDRGKAHYLSCLELKKILASSPRQPEFVFVSSCHSRLVGEVFKSAGAKHVICVKRSEQMLDNVACLFAQAFYSAFFSCHSVCKAYENALATLEATVLAQNLPRAECGKFELLINDYSALHTCVPTFSWTDGSPEYVVSRTEFTDVPAEVEHFVGRKIELYSLSCLLADNRLVTVKGPPGIGKTSVVKALAHHFLERLTFKDGVIFVSIRGLESADSVINEIFLSCKPKPDQSFVQIDDKLQLIASILGEKDVLLILDNAEDSLNKDRVCMLSVLHFLLTKIPKLKILVTSRIAIGPLEDYSEKIHTLYPLDPESAVILLEKRAPRDIDEKEFTELVDEGEADSICQITNPWYGEEGSELRSNKLMHLLAGHPQAISLAAALLHTKTMTELYQELSENSIQPNEMHSLKTSLSLSMECLKGMNKDSVRFFKMLSLFPNGATADELKAIWGANYSVHTGNLQSTSLLVRKDSPDHKEDRYWILPFMADYAFDCLKDFDISHLYSRCCKYHIARLRAFNGQTKESIVFKHIPNEASILACIRRAKQTPAFAEDAIEEQEFLNSRLNESGDCFCFDSDKKDAIPTTRAIEYLPKEESRLTQTIAKRFAASGKRHVGPPSKSTVVTFQTRAGGCKQGSPEIHFTDCNSAVVQIYPVVDPREEEKERLNKGLPVDGKEGKKVCRAVQVLVVYYVTSLVLGHRYRDAKKVLMNFVEEKQIEPEVKANIEKLFGAISDLGNERNECSAEKYYFGARKSFAHESSLLGQATCNFALGNMRRVSVSRVAP